MSQVTYKSEKVSKKRVYYTGSDQVLEGYALCYDRDYGTAAESDIARAYRVEKPATANLKYFAGVVGDEDAGKTGPCWLTVVEPGANPGRLAKVYTDQNCTLGTSKLAVKNASYALGAAGASTVTVATAMQTVDRSGTNGAVLAQLEGAGSVEVDVAAAVTATQDALTDSTGGSADTTLADVLATQTQSTITDSSGGTGATTIAAITNANNAGSADVVPTANAIAGLADRFAEVKADVATLLGNANDNFADVAAQLAKVKVDVAAILTALKNANLMAS